MFFDFSGAFKAIQPALLWDKSWKYRPMPPQLPRLLTIWQSEHYCTWMNGSEWVVNSHGAPQGPVPSLFLFTLNSSDLHQNSESNHHSQKYPDDSGLWAVIGIGKRQSKENGRNFFLMWWKQMPIFNFKLHQCK